MRAVVQRVRHAAVTVNRKQVGAIGNGLLVFLGVANEDTQTDADYLAEKVAGLRIFPDEQGKMNRSVCDTGGEVMIISQFTLYGDVRRGKRPAFTRAAPPRHAETLYNYYVTQMRRQGLVVATGQFQAMMDIALVNPGPVTILLDSTKQF